MFRDLPGVSTLHVDVLPGGIATSIEWPWSLPREVKLYTPERNALAVDCDCGAMLVASSDGVNAVPGGMNSALILLWCSPQARPSGAAISQYFGGAPVREVG
ncbi:MAG: hypothetical protein SF069_04125 [Phycisphaerae bacterium]|nr:hypothetical protein [Phycisphaerae bacterium]